MEPFPHPQLLRPVPPSDLLCSLTQWLDGLPDGTRIECIKTKHKSDADAHYSLDCRAYAGDDGERYNYPDWCMTTRTDGMTTQVVYGYAHGLAAKLTTYNLMEVCRDAD